MPALSILRQSGQVLLHRVAFVEELRQAPGGRLLSELKGTHVSAFRDKIRDLTSILPILLYRENPPSCPCVLPPMNDVAKQMKDGCPSSPRGRTFRHLLWPCLSWALCFLDNRLLDIEPPHQITHVEREGVLQRVMSPFSFSGSTTELQKANPFMSPSAMHGETTNKFACHVHIHSEVMHFLPTPTQRRMGPDCVSYD